MTTTYSADTFNRANGPVGSAETGGSWAASGSAGTWKIAGNQLSGQSTAGYSALLTINDGQSDGAVQATFVSGGSVGVVFRYTSPSDYWVLSLGANNYIRLSYYGNGYTTKADPGVAAVAGDIFRVELTGPAIVVFRNNKQIISINDSTRSTATGCGFLSAGTGVSVFDDFTHTSLSGSTPTPTPTPTPTSSAPPNPTATVHRFFNIGGVAVAVS